MDSKGGVSVKLWLIVLLFIICVTSDAQLQNQINDKQAKIDQLQQSSDQLRADNKKLTERVDANDAIVNRWLMEEGQKP
jgi:cell division protein FtsB